MWYWIANDGGVACAEKLSDRKIRNLTISGFEVYRKMFTSVGWVKHIGIGGVSYNSYSVNKEDVPAQILLQVMLMEE